MKDSKLNLDQNEDKYEKYKKEILNEKMFSFRINNLFMNEFEELIEDILILTENQFFIQIKNRVEAELEEIYSEKIFSDKKILNLIDKGVNYIKTDYNQNYELLNNTFNLYTKNKNKIKFLTSKYRRHCANEVENEFAMHTCSNKLGKFIIVENNFKTEFLICSNCKKVYYETMILCKCYKCNIEYYTEILPNKENEFILPATWDNYHCKQIMKEKMKCIKCHEIIYINLKTNMLICLNKNCNFTSKPNKILWSCAICNQDFKSGAIPYNPLEIEIIKKIIKQTLYLKQYAHPNKVPCCKVNTFFTEFHHKKKCNGVLYTGELNDEVIIVCEKCHAINFYQRFIWICPKCGNHFRDDEHKEVYLSDESDKNNTFKSAEDRKKSGQDLEEDISSNSNNSKNRSNKSKNNNKEENTKEIKAFDLGKETSNKSNEAFLFLVTEANLFKVLDAYTGKILFIQQFPRTQRIRIIRDDSSINQRYVSILFGKRSFFVYDLKYNKFINDISSVINRLNLKDDLLINEEQLNVIMKSFLSLVKENPIYDLKKYQLDAKIFGPNKEQIALYVDYEKSILYILKFYINKKNEQKLIMLHNFNFGKLISISNPKISEDISQYHLSEGKIFYKFINNNLYYILSSELKANKTEENEPKKKPRERLILTILDGKSGKILEEKIIENIDISSVRYLFAENYGLISYTKINKGFKRNEILSFELMNKNVDYSLLRLIKNKFFSPKSNKNQKGESNTENELEIIIKTYIIERSIKHLSISKSKYNKGNKYILMVFDNNDLQLIKRDELSPRRPNMIKIKGKPTFDPETNSIYADKELPGYNPVIHLNPNNRFVNKDKSEVYDVKTLEGDNESSFIACIIGGNLECKEMYPDKLYDKLNPEFKKELLMAVTLGFVVFIFFFRKYHIKAEFMKIFIGENDK